MEGWYTINQISKELNIPETTARRYTVTFKEFFPSRTFGGRYDKYHEKAIHIVGTIYDLYAQNKKAEEIREHLKAEFPIVIDVETDTKSEEAKRSINLLDTRKELIESVKRQNELFEKNINALEVVDKLVSVVNSQQEEIKELRELLHHHTTKLENIVKVRENKKSFWRSLFR